MAYKIFLDDIRVPTDIYSDTNNDEWLIIRNLTDFKNKVESDGVPDYISFDHDLSDINSETNEENTGLTCAKFLVDFCMNNNIKLLDFYVHSANPCGKDNINGLLNNFKKYQLYT